MAHVVAVMRSVHTQEAQQTDAQGAVRDTDGAEAQLPPCRPQPIRVQRAPISGAGAAWVTASRVVLRSLELAGHSRVTAAARAVAAFICHLEVWCHPVHVLWT